MRVNYRPRSHFFPRRDPFSRVLYAFQDPKPRLSQTLKMVETRTNSVTRRTMCPSCSKPVRLCLCSRIRNPGLENSVSVTILQHSLERKHPLNSVRIAKLGLKNVTVATVSDVNFEASFVIRLREGDAEAVSGRDCFDFDQIVERSETQKGEFEHVGIPAKRPIDKISNLVDVNDSFRNRFGGKNNDRRSPMGQNSVIPMSLHDSMNLKRGDGLAIGEGSADEDENPDVDECMVRTNESDCLKAEFDPLGVSPGHGGVALVATVGKYGAVSSLSHIWKQNIWVEKPDFNEVLSYPSAREAFARGFIVKKLQKRSLNEGKELEEEFEEFEIEVPPGSLLLFPSENAVGIAGLDSAGFRVKNLIVLDGTWAKAKRIYNENPWLKLLPHLKLNLKEMSLYGDVRHQPKEGYLSTIESIVYALKAVGDNPEGLDDLLDVFGSMVGDQRRCKDERLNKVSQL